MNAKLLAPADNFHRVHTYFKGSPCHPDGRRMLYLKFQNLRAPAAVCLLDRESGRETAIGASRHFNYHSGASQYFCAGGAKVIYQSRRDRLAVYDLRSGKTRDYAGRLCPYAGNLHEYFVEIDADFPRQRQGRMGIYLRRIDGTGKRCLATVDDLLAAHPRGNMLRLARLRFRLGAEISPDQRRVILFLVTRDGSLVRDYYTCDMQGGNLEFHGNLGGHIMWHPDSRRILAFAVSWSTIMGEFPRRAGAPRGYYGRLAEYDTCTRKMRVLSPFPIRGGCHVSPAPDGNLVALDEIQPDAASILMFNYATGKITRLCRQDYRAPLEKTSASRSAKQYDINPHPVFDPGSRRIVFNACPDRRVGLYECEIGGTGT